MAIFCQHGYGPSSCLKVWTFHYQLKDGQFLKKGSTPLHEIVRVISKEADCEGVQWVQLAQDRNKWQPLPRHKDGDFSIGWTSANVK